MRRFRIMSPSLPYRMIARLRSIGGRMVIVENRRGEATYERGRLVGRITDRGRLRFQVEDARAPGCPDCKFRGVKVGGERGWWWCDFCRHHFQRKEGAGAGASPGKQSPAEPQGDEDRWPDEGLSHPPPKNQQTARLTFSEPQGDVVEKTARWLFLRLMRDRKVPDPSWLSLTERQRNGWIGDAHSLLAAITPLLPGPSYVLQRMLGEAERRRDETEGEPWKAVAVERASVLGEVIRTLDAFAALDTPAPSESRTVRLAPEEIDALCYAAAERPRAKDAQALDRAVNKLLAARTATPSEPRKGDTSGDDVPE